MGTQILRAVKVLFQPTQARPAGLFNLVETNLQKIVIIMELLLCTMLRCSMRRMTEICF